MSVMSFYFPFGEQLHPVVQEDKSPKKAFVLGVYASAVHARWEKNGQVICPALAVASEPRIFWDGNLSEAKSIIEKINIPSECGSLKPSDSRFNGPSAKILDKNILAPLGLNRQDVWLCDLLPEARLNSNQINRILKSYDPLKAQYGLNEVTVPPRPKDGEDSFCNAERAKEVTKELLASQANLLILLGDIPFKKYLTRVGENLSLGNSLDEYARQYGYGHVSQVLIDGKCFSLLPLAHPRQIGGLGSYNQKWRDLHAAWEKEIANDGDTIEIL